MPKDQDVMGQRRKRLRMDLAEWAILGMDVLEETVLNLEGLEEEVRIIKRRVREHMKALADRPTQETDHD